MYLLPQILHSKAGLQVWSELFYENYSMYSWLAYCGMVTQQEHADRTTVWAVFLEQFSVPFDVYKKLWIWWIFIKLQEIHMFFQEMYSYAFQIGIIFLSFGPIYLLAIAYKL